MPDPFLGACSLELGLGSQRDPFAAADNSPLQRGVLGETVSETRETGERDKW